MRVVLKNLVCGMAEMTGINTVLRRMHQQQLVVLCYHSVLDSMPPNASVLYRNVPTVRQFAAQLEAVLGHFRPIALDDLLSACRGDQPLPPRSVLVTFDDGYENNLTFAAPTLQRLGVPAVMHISTGYIGTSRVLWPQELELRLLGWPQDQVPAPEGADLPFPAPGSARVELCDALRARCKRLPDDARERYMDRLREVPLEVGADRELLAFLSWDQVRELSRQGFAIGSHTVEHPMLTRISPERLKHELVDSRARIERELGMPCRALAYPNGGIADFSVTVQEATKAAGYEVAFTLVEGSNRAQMNPFTIDRVCAPAAVSKPVFLSRLGGILSLLHRPHSNRN